jgi:hypothetical protein
MSAMDLAKFLLARIAEDRQQIERVIDASPHWPRDPSNPQDPARLLAECDTKRHIVAQAGQAEADYNAHNAPWPGPDGLYGWLLRSLALPYADHPEYRPEWRP